MGVCARATDPVWSYERERGLLEKRGMENSYDAVLATLAREPGSAVTILDSSGRIHFANNHTLRICVGTDADPGSIVGKSLDDIGYPRAWIDERLGIVRRIKESGDEFLVRSIWNGRQLFSWYRALEPTDQCPGERAGGDTEPDDAFRVLIVTRAVQAGQESEYLIGHELEVVESKMVHLGPLDALSKRELEVLALIGHGKTTRQIGDALHRSVKTIENHRIALGRKLRKANRVELAILAREAGLRVEDAALRRVPNDDKTPAA